ncbi:MAG: hypothetical protein EON90_15115 [Brevundimonas sp.]|nr:MAG: hypothetical protein EON90_15115 [Brevundimonas sp.]
MILIALAIQAATAVPSDCSAAEHRQLDFWLGRWTVTDTATGAPAGRSWIEPVYKGCAVRETYEGLDGFEGGSTSLWDRAGGEWVQFGTGSTGARMQFTGRWDGVRMSLLTSQVRPGRGPLLIRMRLQPLEDGGVRQWSDMSSDQGETWRPRYDFTYQPLAE